MFESGARGNVWARRLAFGSFIALVWVKAASKSPVENVQFPAVMVGAVLAFEIAIWYRARLERDHAFVDDELEAFRRSSTLVVTAVLAGMLAIAAAVLRDPWYALLAVVFGYIGFLFSRYMPDALFGVSGENVEQA